MGLIRNHRGKPLAKFVAILATAKGEKVADKGNINCIRGPIQRALPDGSTWEAVCYVLEPRVSLATGVLETNGGEVVEIPGGGRVY